MATLTQTQPPAAFLISEANGLRSREQGTLVTGQNLTSGTVVQDNGSGKLTAYVDGGTAVGIMLYDTDATAADVECAYIARDAEVNLKLLTYPAETTAGNEEADTIASLATIGIAVRD